jgi:hypothetical protein
MKSDGVGCFIDCPACGRCLAKGFWIGTCVGGACYVISSDMVSECRPVAHRSRPINLRHKE